MVPQLGDPLDGRVAEGHLVVDGQRQQENVRLEPTQKTSSRRRQSVSRVQTTTTKRKLFLRPGKKGAATSRTLPGRPGTRSKIGDHSKKIKKNGNFTVSHKVTLYSASLMRNICVWLSNLRNGNESVDWRATLCGPLFVCWFVCFSFVDETAHRMETVNGFAWPTNEVKVGESKSRGQRKTNQRGVQVSRKGILLAFFLTTQGRHRTEPFIIAPKKIEFKQIRAKIINLNHEQVYQFESMMHQNLTLMKIQ